MAHKTQRTLLARDLLPHAQRLHGPAVADGTPLAAVHRGWIRLRARLAGNPDRAVLVEAARGERCAAAAYDDAVTDRLPLDARALIEAQDLGVRVAGRLIRDANAPDQRP